MEVIGDLMRDIIVLLLIILVVRYFWRKRKKRKEKVNMIEDFVRNLPNFTANEWLIAGDGSRAIAIDKNIRQLAIVWNGNQYRIFKGNEIKSVKYIEDGHHRHTTEGFLSETTTVSVKSIGFSISFFDLDFTSFSFLVGGGTNVGSELYNIYKNRSIHWCNLIDTLAIKYSSGN